MNRADVALSIYAALLSNGRDPSNSIEQSVRLADMFIEKLKEFETAEAPQQGRKKRKTA